MAEPLADLPAEVSACLCGRAARRQAQAGQVLRKIGEQQAKAIECLTPFAKFYGNHPREVRCYAA